MFLAKSLDEKLHWKGYKKKKIGRQFEVLKVNKILLYEPILIPVWIYGFQLWS